MSTISVNRFEGGMTPDIRDESIGVSKVIKHFDILTRPNSLTPHYSQSNADTDPTKHYQFSDFIYYNSIVYGIGVDGTSNFTTVHTKSDFTATVWGSQSNNAGGNGNFVAGVFVEYHGFAYGFNSDGTVFKNDLSGSIAWNDAITTIGSAASLGNCAGIVHSKDDCLYMGTQNIIGRNNNGSWNAAVLTLPPKYLITSLCEYGNYLAIACAPKYSGKSVVYLWDRDSSLNTITEVIDFGLGSLKIIEQLSGQIIGISLQSDVLTGGTSNKVIFRSYGGSTADVFKELLVTYASSTTAIGHGQKYSSNRLYFLGDFLIDSVLINGVWAIGKNQYGRWTVWFDRLPNNDIGVVSGGMRGFFMIGDFLFAAYNDSGYKLTQTTTNSFSGSSVIETVINPQMPLVDRTKQKQVTVIAVSCDPIPSGGQVICKYKVDGGSYKTIFTETTQGKVTIEKTVKSVTGREFQFRVESTGGVIISEIKYQYKVVKTLI